MQIDLNKLHRFYECNLEGYRRRDILEITKTFLKLMNKSIQKPYHNVFLNYRSFTEFVWKDWLGFSEESKKQQPAENYRTKKHKSMSFPKLTDQSLMPYGKYKGAKMGNIPSEYLIWLWDNNACSGTIKEYIKENIEHLRLEVKQNRKQQTR